MGTHQKWDINNLKHVNINTINLKLVKKLLLQGLFQYLDIYPLQKSTLFPIGSVLCFNHMKNENKIDKDEPPGIHVTQDDHDYETPEPVISENILNSSEAGVTDLSETLDVSPIKFQIKKKKVAELSEGTKYHFQKEYNKAQEKLKLKFASVAAPGRSSDFIKSIINETDISFKEDREIPEDLKNLIQIYEKSDTLEKTVILSIADHNKYSKDTIMKYFHCTKYKVDQARKLKGLANELEMPNKATITRSKLNIQKYENFLDCLFNIKFLQGIAYCVTNLKFDNGYFQKIAHVAKYLYHFILLGGLRKF